MLEGIWAWLGGFVVLKISGGGQERFLNLALQRGIEVWDTVWLEGDVLELRAARADLRELKRIAKISGCRLVPGRGRGLPFALAYLCGRKTFAVGLVLFAAGLFAMSQIVFTVNVLPQEELRALDVEEVRDFAEGLGVRPGAIYHRLDVDAIEAELSEEIPELSWVYIERQGTVVNIKVAERSIYPDELENATRGAIWANRDALVEDVLLKRGQAVAQHGDTVQEGDLLVAPLSDGRADAIVHARVWYSGYGEAALSEESCEPVGRAAAVYSLARADGGGLRLWGEAPAVADGQRLAESTDECVLRFWGADFCLRRTVLQPMNVDVRTISEEEARQAAYQAAVHIIYAQQNSESKLLNEKVDYSLVDGVLCCDVEWECLEEIGTHLPRGN